jgi:hypothetical protein
MRNQKEQIMRAGYYKNGVKALKNKAIQKRTK